VPRRAHVKTVHRGRIELDAAEARHFRDVLRLTEGEEVELFDDAGKIGAGVIVECKPARVAVEIHAVREPDATGMALTIASAVPKGERADWMIEKLSELGVARFIPLNAARSVVLPEGKNKRDRWLRIAIESAKQSRRRGVMEIAELTRVTDLLESGLGVSPEHSSGATNEALRRDAQATFHLSTSPDATSIRAALAPPPRALTLLIGPEGGWSDDELALFARHDVKGLKLTDTILRVETAAITAAAVVATLSIGNPKSKIENPK
jgi:16S rRNA (uracil1498-N3)-methyltransferase